ncbi:MAG: iron complex outermembrane receptor protein [Bermanella sp.]|jgi:iron complex outermembrane receptor protein
MKYRSFAASALLIALCASYPVSAQTSSTASGGKNRNASSLEEIIVTARRRRESLQETPIAVSAMSGAELEERGIINVKELTKSVPSLEITESIANLIYIRGVGQRTGFARVDPTVGVYLDNIYLPRADGQLLDTVDVENIQVLRGPQGTLFGKNTTGGAMVMTLEKPSDTTEGYVSGSLGNYNRQTLRAAYNTPITDSLFARVAFNYIKDDGYFKDISQGESNSSKNRQSLMLQTRWDASSNVSVDSLLYFGRVRERLAGTNCKVSNPDGLFINGLYLMWPGDTDPSNPKAYAENCESNSAERLGDLTSNMGPKSLMDKELDTILLASTVDWQLSDDLAFKLVFGAREAKKGPLISSDQDGGPANFNESHSTTDSDRNSYSVEFQINGSMFESRVNYTAGLFGMQETNTEEFTLINSLNGIDASTLAQIAGGQEPTRPVAPVTPLVGIFVDPLLISQFDLKNVTLAAFLQASWDMTDNLELTLGGRWTAETRESDLVVTGSDRAAIGQRLLTSGLGFGPAVEGFNPFLGSWLQDPVGLAMSLFPDANGDGIDDFPLASEPTQRSNRKETFEKFTPMVSLSYQLPESLIEDSFLDSVMTYGTWSTGFKSGFFEPRGVDGLARVEPEEVENLEVGIKIEALKRSVRINFAVYQMDFDNQQMIQVDADSRNNLIVIFDNAGRSEISGSELEVLWIPMPSMAINLAASKNEYRFTEFLDNNLMQAVLGNQVSVDRSDEPFPVSPEETLSIGIQHAFITSIGTFIPRLDYSYKSKTYYGLDRGSYTAYKRDESLAGQDAYTVLDARLSWESINGSTSVAAFVKNLTDERNLVGIASVGDSLATFFQTYGEPRMLGMDVKWRF